MEKPKRNCPRFFEQENKRNLSNRSGIDLMEITSRCSVETATEMSSSLRVVGGRVSLFWQDERVLPENDVIDYVGLGFFHYVIGTSIIN